MEELTNVWSVDLRWLRNFKNDPILSQQKMFDEITAPRIRTPKAAGGHGGLRASTRFDAKSENICNVSISLTLCLLLYALRD